MQSLTEGSKLPFQIQITFMKLDGSKCQRVITEYRPVTHDRSLAEKTLDIRVVSANLAQQSARLAQQVSILL